MKYLLETYFDNNRKSLAIATHKSESTVEFWFRTKPRLVNDDTLELLLFKLNEKNRKIVLPEHLDIEIRTKYGYSKC